MRIFRINQRLKLLIISESMLSHETLLVIPKIEADLFA